MYLMVIHTAEQLAIQSARASEPITFLLSAHSSGPINTAEQTFSNKADESSKSEHISRSDLISFLNTGRSYIKKSTTIKQLI